MKILWFTWKDKKHPLAGGAEIVNEEIAKRLVKNGHQVVFITSGFKNVESEEIVDGYKVVRLGNRWTIYWKAFRYYKNYLHGWADLVIDEVNTIPFFAKFYVKEKNIILVYQLCREIWFYQMFFPLNILGYFLELIFLYVLKDRYVITESESTKIDLQRYGFQKDKIFVFPIGLENSPISNDDFNNQIKEIVPTLFFLGSIRPMKRPDHVLKAFEIAKKDIPELRLWIAGSGQGRFAENFFKRIYSSKFKDDILYFGQVSIERKLLLLQKAHLIAVTSLKEGWGLIVTEANSQGTPAIVYNVDGLRDSCKNYVTGLITKKNSPVYLAKNIIKLIKDKRLYQQLHINAWEDSQNYTYLKSFQSFVDIINKINEKI